MNNIKIAIFCDLDGFANSIRPLEIKKFLEKRGFEIAIISSPHISRLSPDKNSFFSKLPSLAPIKLFLYVVELLLHIYYKYPHFFVESYYFFLLMLNIKYRSVVLCKMIKKSNYKVVICENMNDSYMFQYDMNCLKILDCACPLADELYYSKRISKKYYEKLSSFYKKLYSCADYLSFHWYLYTNYVKDNIYNGDNIYELNWGCHQKDISERAQYNQKPKIIFLGYLDGPWVNKPLLSSLSKKYTIDVYGGPPPDEKYGLNYKGYAPKTNVISNYQFGLITISKDKLRRSSFSSKHLEYLSYGLPVLTPEWRRDQLLDDVSIYYNEDTFLDRIREYSEFSKWKRMSELSYNKAKDLDWNNTLIPLYTIIQKYLLSSKKN